MDCRNITKIVRNMMLYKNSINKEKDYFNDSEFEMLRYIVKKDGISLVDLATYLNVAKSLITRMSKKLLKLGYIEILDDTKDKRKKILVATNKARAIKQEVANEEVVFYNACLKVLSDEELAMFDKLVNKVYLESKRLRKSGFKDVKN
ncbi:MAG: MarR family transcriptional regulator [Candidatus Caccosoma sp.]|nr:MarR family transcriptional regulator [Candidatus Caccosoma sp.]